MLQIASQSFPELNALNFFFVTVKDTSAGNETYLPYWSPGGPEDFPL